MWSSSTLFLRNDISGDDLLEFVSHHPKLSGWGTAGKRQRDAEKREVDKLRRRTPGSYTHYHREHPTDEVTHFGDDDCCVPWSSLVGALDEIRIADERSTIVEIEVDAAVIEWGDRFSRIPPRLNLTDVCASEASSEASDGSIVLSVDGQLPQRPPETDPPSRDFRGRTRRSRRATLEISRCRIKLEQPNASEKVWLWFFDVLKELREIPDTDWASILALLLGVAADEDLLAFRSRHVFEINQCLKLLNRSSNPDVHAQQHDEALQAICSNSYWSTLLVEALGEIEQREWLEMVMRRGDEKTFADVDYFDAYYRGSRLLTCLALLFHDRAVEGSSREEAATALCCDSRGFLSTLLRLVIATWDEGWGASVDSLCGKARTVFFMVSNHSSFVDLPDAAAIFDAAIRSIEVTRGGGLLLPLVRKATRNLDVISPDGLNPLLDYFQSGVTAFHHALVEAWRHLDKSEPILPQQTLAAGLELMRLLNLATCAEASSWWGDVAKHILRYVGSSSLCRVSCPAAARVLAIAQPSDGSKRFKMPFVTSSSTQARSIVHTTRFRVKVRLKTMDRASCLGSMTANAAPSGNHQRIG